MWWPPRTPAGAHPGAVAGVKIAGRVVSLFDQNEAARAPALVDEVKAGATVLVVSDAGMPLINDPGYRLVTACVAAGLPVSCLPGPSAVTTALAVSGLPSDRFCFEGFAPRKRSAGGRGSPAWRANREPRCSSSRRAGWGSVWRRGRRTRRRPARRGVPRTDQGARGGAARVAGRTGGLGGRGVLGEITVVLAGPGRARTCRRWSPRSTSWSPTACGSRTRARGWSTHPGAPSRRELYDAVLRSRDT